MSDNIFVIKRSNVLKVITRSVIQLFPSIVPFTFTATEDDQTVFTFADEPAQIISLAINGAIQNQAAADFTISGKTLTLSSGIDSGDIVYGVYARQYTPLITTFYFVAEEGQTIFLLDTAPVSVFSVAVNGAMKNSLAGDFTIVDKTLTLAVAVHAGDKITGSYQG